MRDLPAIEAKDTGLLSKDKLLAGEISDVPSDEAVNSETDRDEDIL